MQNSKFPRRESTRTTFNRRQFLAAGAAAWTVAQTSPPTLFAQAGGTNRGSPPAVPKIEPGFVGPQFFDEHEKRALIEVLEAGSPFRYWGPGKPEKVKQFEEAFADHMGTRFALGVTSGTAALDCAITGLGVGPGDEVIVPAYTWWSDYTCVVHAGALPVFAEIDRTFNLDPEDFRKKITSRTKAVIPVHLLGGQCDMDPILDIAEKNGIGVLEDCAQCVGGSYRGRKLGALGAVGIYSFQINKMITSGEGGALVTNDPLVYERAARFHDMGGMRTVFSDRLGATQVPTFAGENFRMSELTGAVLGAQLPKLDRMVAAMRGHAELIREGLAGLSGIRMRRRPDPQGDIGYAVYFETSNRSRRDQCIQFLRSRHVPASTLTGSVLLPVEESVINKRARHPVWPSFRSPEGRAIQYGAQCCPKTIEILDRFVQIRIGPKYTQRIDDYIVDTVREAWSTVV